MRVMLLRAFWGHRQGKIGRIDKLGWLHLKGSPAAATHPQDCGSLFRVL